MTIIEQDKLVETTDRDTDDLPIAHLPDDDSMEELLRGGRPSRALCGAPMLGILATIPHALCETCSEEADRLGIRHTE